MKSISNFYFIFLLILGSCSFLVSCNNKTTATAEKEKTEEEKPEQVKTMILKKQSVDRQLKLSTNLEGYETIHIASTSMNSIVEHIYVEIGTNVKKGDMLARMDQTNYNNSKITLANLKKEMQRLEALLEVGSISEQTYDQTKVTYDQTKENTTYLRDNTFIKSPTTGVVSEKYLEDGELYTGAQPILDVVEIDKLKAIIAIPESYLPHVKENMKITISTEIYKNKTFTGTIEIVYPTIDPSTHTFQCKVVIPNKDRILKPGMYVTSTINVGKGDIIAVPYQSVEKLVGSNERYVFINNNGYAQRVTVNLGQRVDENIEIIAPEIEEGVEYIYVGQHRLVDGMKINVVD